MNILYAINALAHTLITGSMILFFILLYGNSNAIIHKWRLLSHWTLKIFLVGIICTSGLNASTSAASIMNDYVPNPVMLGEVIMNFFLAVLFVWLVVFHRYHFMRVAPRRTNGNRSRARPQKTTIKRTNKKPAPVRKTR